MHWKVFLPHLEEDMSIQIEELKEGVIARMSIYNFLVLCQFCLFLNAVIFKALCSVTVSLYEDFTCNSCVSLSLDRQSLVDESWEGHASLPKTSINLTCYNHKIHFISDHVLLPKPFKIEQRGPFRLFFFPSKTRPARQFLLHIFEGQAHSCHLGCLRHPQLKL